MPGLAVLRHLVLYRPVQHSRSLRWPASMEPALATLPDCAILPAPMATALYRHVLAGKLAGH